MDVYTASKDTSIAAYIDWLIDKINSIGHLVMQDFVVITLKRLLTGETSASQH